MMCRDWQTSVPAKHWRMVIALIATALTVAVAAPAFAQQEGESEFDFEDEASILEFRPQSFNVEFEELIVRLGDHDRLEVEYEISSDSWSQVEDGNIDLWLEMWIPLRIVYRFLPFPRVRTVEPLTTREGTILFPYWLDVDRDNLIDVCPLAQAEGEEPGDYIAWACGGGPKSYRVGSDWGPELGVGTTFQMRREYAALELNYWYWIVPNGLYVFPQPLPRTLPLQLPFRDPRRGLTYPPGRRP